jgi:fatty acid synthase
LIFWFVFQKVSADGRPVWYVFAGMGTQWPNMGRDLMSISVFRESIMKSHAALEPYNINLYDMLTNAKEDTFNGTLNSFIGIASIQVC